jgi:hypothetical protein
MKAIIILIVSFLLLNVLDTWTTYKGFQEFGYEIEANPLVKLSFKHYGFTPLLVAKVTVVPLVCYWFWRSDKNKKISKNTKEFNTIMFIFINVVYLAAVIMNLMVVL